MSKNLITSILLLFSLFLKGQDSLEVAVINEVLFDLPYTKGLARIQLAEETSSCSITSNYGSLDVHKDIISEDLFKEIMSNRRSIRRLWRTDEIKNVRLLNGSDIDQLQERNQKTIEGRYSSFFYYLALPIFNDKQDCSIIEVAHGTARDRMIGGFFLARKINGKWSIIKQIGSYAT